MKRKQKQVALPASIDQITQSIVVLRGQKVLLDTDLAALYGVPTKVLLQSVKRNAIRFPDDFMLQLTPDEWAIEVTICDLKCNPRRTPVCTIRVYRARCCHALVSS